MNGRSILGMLNDASKSKVNLRLHEKLDGTPDEASTQSVKELSSKIEEISDKIFVDLEEELEEFTARIPLREMTGQDVAEFLLRVDILLVDIDKVLEEIAIDSEITELAYKDAYNDFYQKLFEGTVGDRVSYAESKTVKERYVSFVKSKLLSSVSSRRNAVDKVYKSIERWMWRSIRSEG